MSHHPEITDQEAEAFLAEFGFDPRAIGPQPPASDPATGHRPPATSNQRPARHTVLRGAVAYSDASCYGG